MLTTVDAGWWTRGILFYSIFIYIWNFPNEEFNNKPIWCLSLQCGVHSWTQLNSTLTSKSSLKQAPCNMGFTVSPSPDELWGVGQSVWEQEWKGKNKDKLGGEYTHLQQTVQWQVSLCLWNIKVRSQMPNSHATTHLVLFTLCTFLSVGTWISVGMRGPLKEHKGKLLSCTVP